MDLFELLTILSFVIGIKNLDLNEEQAQILDSHLNRQDKELLSKIIQQNEEIIRLLKENKHV